MSKRVIDSLRASHALPQPPKVNCLKELLADRDEYIRQRTFEIARLMENPDFENTSVGDALTSAIVELSNCTRVSYHHPQVVEHFYKAAVIEAMADGTIAVSTQRVLNEIQLLLIKTTPSAIVDEIASRYNGEGTNKPSDAYNEVCHDPDPEPENADAVRDKPSPENAHTIAALRKKLDNLEYVPETEAVAFQLKTQIYKLEREANTNEWPNVVGP